MRRKLSSGPATVVASVLLAGLTACTGSHHVAGPVPSTSVTPGASTSAPSTSGGSTSGGSTSGGSIPGSSTSGASTSGAATTPVSAASPPDLCLGTEHPQDAADAYMGAVSAGQVAQAQACVYPGTVSEATTRSLVSRAAQTAVYLPDPAQSTASVFAYKGNGHTVGVTVTTEPDGRFWVTAVAVD